MIRPFQGGTRNSKAYKEYYAIATGEAAPMPKASVRRTRSADEETGSKPGVLDVPTNELEEELSWNSTNDEGDDNEEKDDDGDEEDEGVRDDDKDDEEEGRDDKHEFDDDESDEEIRDEESFDPVPQTPKDSEDEGDGKEDLSLNVGREEGHVEDEEEYELYRDVNINQRRRIQSNLEVEDSHVTLTSVNPNGQQQSSSVSSQFVTSMLNLTLDVGMESIFKTTSQLDVQTPTSVAPLPMSAPTMTSSTIATITTSQAPILPITVLSDIIQNLPNFGLLFRFVDRLRIEQAVNEQLKAEVLTRSSHSSRTSYTVAADLSEMELKKILIKKMEGNKSIQRSDEQRNLYKALVDAYESDKIILDTYEETVTLKRRRDDDADKDEEPFAGPDRGSKRRREGKEPESASALTETATMSAGRSTQRSRSRQASANEFALAEEPIVNTLTPELLAGPTYELMKGSCKSLIELEYHLEEVYKATTDQLDWVNPEGQQYPHTLLQPLPLIPDNRGRRVIPFEHFINNDLEYLRGGASSRKYTTSITKTKAADYRHIKWIEGLVPRTMWINEPIGYDKHALWGRRILAVTELKIVEWHSYKHLDWITVRRDDDKLYKFKEGDFKRLRIQDVKDMLLLLVQRKLTNLTVKECFTFKVSLRMFTRSIVIQRPVEDLQLGVESYQKKLNLTKLDSYRSDLKRKEAYTAYSNPRGFIYQNKDKKNRLMRIDELHKFSDGTLIDVRITLDDCLKGIRMWYLPQTIWRKSDKDRAAAMIQAIDKRLKTRRIMRSLERYKVVRYRYLNPMIQPEPEESTQGYPLVSVEVLSTTTAAATTPFISNRALPHPHHRNHHPHLHAATAAVLITSTTVSPSHPVATTATLVTSSPQPHEPPPPPPPSPRHLQPPVQDSSSSHSLPDSSVDTPATIFMRPSRKGCRSPAISLPLATPIPRALSTIHADLLPPRKRIRDVQADIDDDTTTTKTATAREADVRVKVGIGS
uniref:Uncharacterized protein n=1 Tax=Tanacetum cinerariifolium TaxID=118510 RepID=A0A6L2LBU3_TANCI|nr:hypothetical protein [Tanacetum cinerariifolium]